MSGDPSDFGFQDDTAVRMHASPCTEDPGAGCLWSSKFRISSYQTREHWRHKGNIDEYDHMQI